MSPVNSVNGVGAQRHSMLRLNAGSISTTRGPRHNQLAGKRWARFNRNGNNRAAESGVWVGVKVQRKKVLRAITNETNHPRR